MTVCPINVHLPRTRRARRDLTHVRASTVITLFQYNY